MRNLKVDGTRHFYKTTGSGPPMILIHGNSGDHRYFEKQYPFFSKYFTIYAPDTEAHGRSAYSGKPLTASRVAKNLNKMMKKLSLRDPVILGFSDGANIAKNLALITKKPLKALILIGGNIQPYGLKPWVMIGSEIVEKLTWGLSIFSKKLATQAEIFRLSNLGAQLEYKDLAHINCPSLLLAGENDLIDTSHTLAMAEWIKDSEAHIIQGAGHHLLKTHHEKVNQLILDYLRKKGIL